MNLSIIYSIYLIIFICYHAAFTVCCLCFVFLYQFISVHIKSCWHVMYGRFRLIEGHYYVENQLFNLVQPNLNYILNNLQNIDINRSKKHIGSFLIPSS